MALLGVRVDPETHKSFKLWCVRRGLNMSDVVRQLVESWIAEQERLDKSSEPEAQ